MTSADRRFLLPAQTDRASAGLLSGTDGPKRLDVILLRVILAPYVPPSPVFGCGLWSSLDISIGAWCLHGR